MTEAHSEFLLAHAMRDHRAGRLEAAIPVYRTLLNRHPDNPDLNHLLALALHPSDCGGAQAGLRRTLALAPETDLYQLSAARLAEETGRIDVAISCYRRCLAMSERADGPLGLGRLLHRVGLVVEAAAAFRRLIRISPEHVDAHGLLGAALADAGEDAGAIASLRRALTLTPATAEAWYALSLVYVKAPAKSEAAMEAAERAAHIVPTAPEPHLTRARALLVQGRLREALSARRAAIALAPADAQSHY